MRIVLSLLVIVVAVLIAPFAAEGGGASMGFLNVSAVMQPSAVLTLDFRPLSFSISEADIERGYIDVPTASVLTVSSGRIVPQVVLEFDPSEGPFKNLSLRSAPAKAAGGATAAPREGQPMRTADANSATIGYRLLLADKVGRTRPSIPLVLSITL